MTAAQTAIGIDDIALHIPRLVLPMSTFAELRDLNLAKLQRGLGLEAMAVPDTHEDTATMGANAVLKVILRNGIDPSRIGRIYLGTESALDGAKPTATYILDMLTQRLAAEHGPDCFRHCDVVDLTFACIGAVDALHNSLDWVARGGEEADRIAIVVFADHAKYDRGSTGEYTQGAGGGAVLIRHNPRLLAIPDCWGVATRPVHDFFKPRRSVGVRSLVDRVLDLARDAGADLDDTLTDAILDSVGTPTDDPVFERSHFEVHRDTPVFDGPLSNRSYATAVKEAFGDFRRHAIASGRLKPNTDAILTEQWRRVVLHLPYAFQGKRMFPDVFRHDRRGTPLAEELEAIVGPPPTEAELPDPADLARAWDKYRRAISKTPAFKAFIAEKVERGQRASSLVGNQYTGSIFLALVSTLEADLADHTDLVGAPIGLCGYGSGAKAKVFEAVVQPRWREVAEQWGVFDALAERVEVDAPTYEALHRGAVSGSVVSPSGEFALESIGRDGDLEGHRRYVWVPHTAPLAQAV